MKYALIKDNIVIQIQPNKEKGFIEVKDYVICGMVKTDAGFIIPEVVKTPEEINQQKIEKAQKYLTDTDFYMTIDKYETLTADKKQELIVSRQKARDIINNLSNL